MAYARHGRDCDWYIFWHQHKGDVLETMSARDLRRPQQPHEARYDPRRIGQMTPTIRTTWTHRRTLFAILVSLILASLSDLEGQSKPSFSGIYPHLALFNDEGECGTGAVVPWAGRLWAITYAPHRPRGSSDSLYEITPDLELIVRSESIGGTPANRMIHRESNQLFIGPYVIDAAQRVRTIPYSKMFGRLTGNARHLTDPANKIYYATMEEGFYEVDVQTLQVTTLYHDEQVKTGPKADLPGYHGKGLYSGQGRLVYANNGEQNAAARRNPFTASGVLAEWNGSAWSTVLRNQFTEVTGPGGIYGNANPKSDPIWSVGWDAKSLILMLLDHGRWHRFRLPKGSHSYDGAHGWNTEWPRIRDVGESSLLMTMHGIFWRFPRHFSAQNSSGIRARSSYLKVVGDFCRWQNRIVLGCDDAAKNEFLNKRRAKGNIPGPQSQSNFWFVAPAQLDQIGPVLARGAVWLEEDVTAQTMSDPILFSGFDRRAVHLAHNGAAPAMFNFEIDRNGDGTWTVLRSVKVPAHGYRWLEFGPQVVGSWVRLRAGTPIVGATAQFTFANDDERSHNSPTKFASLARPGAENPTGGLLRARGGNKRTLHFAAKSRHGALGYYELSGDIKLRPVDDTSTHSWLQQNAEIPSRQGVIELDSASVIYIADDGQRFRIPRGGPAEFDRPGPLGWSRLDREVATERDLFNCHGTFYELPAVSAGGFARIRPISTHRRRISDYCSYRGLLVMSGLQAAAANPHTIRSTDGKTALWVGAIDDIWELGKPTGRGGPWLNTAVTSGRASEPYLMTGYDRKTLTLSATDPVTITAEVDLTGVGLWQQYRSLPLAGGGKKVTHVFPMAFQAYWIRFRSDKATTATAQLVYE